MATILQDGTGKGFQAKVDNTNRLETRGIMEEGRVEGAANGELLLLEHHSYHKQLLLKTDFFIFG